MRDLNVTKLSFIVCSAEQVDQDVRQNALDTVSFREYLTDSGFTFKEAQGCYKGVKEHSFIIFLEGVIIDEFRMIKDVLHNYNQESLLFVNKDRKARLQYINYSHDPQIEWLGDWKLVSSCVAVHPNIDAYTIDLETNSYYIVS